ncbi:hypothetical protein [uncultured Parvibaculum sp.]|jgi:hypothetical protein|uniref:hypothetical protein n=1 Tax=uncultured Parvibaculum sp. TaxID=291828 RepID=UPI0030EEC278|tara:strand:- start:34710 stop:35054 length:345 start_codon:yes stop_codon:yes gene_type:complete
MKFVARLILVAVLAVFAVSSVAHAAGSADMAAAMIASGDAAMPMSDCDACDDTGAGEMGLACDLVCGAGSFAAVVAPQAYGIVSSPREALGPAVTQDFCGLSSPPAKHPPRTLI